MTEERLDRHIYQYVEAELRNYKTYQRLIQDYNKELEYTGIKSAMSKDPTGRFPQGEPTDNTYNEASRIIANEARMVRIIDMMRCIEDILLDLSDLERRLVELKYFQNLLTDQGVMRELHIGMTKYYGDKRRIIKRFALRMRLI